MKKGIIGYVVLMLIVGLCVSQAAGENLTIKTEGRVTIELIFSDAAFSNTLAVFSPTLDLAISGCKLEPAVGLLGKHILSERLSQRGCRVELDADPTTEGIQGFPVDTTFEFQLCAQTESDPDCEYVWSSDPSKNSDNFDHVETTVLFDSDPDLQNRIHKLAWEDLPGGGDQDFNDLIAIVRVEVDTDGDGLWDDWETYGIDTDGDGTPELDLHALGADPKRKDIFVEIDYMDCNIGSGDCAAGDTHSHEPKQAAIDAVIDAFANAPVKNPDLSRGITLHVDINDAIPHHNMSSIDACFSGTDIEDFDFLKKSHFGSKNPRRFAYHYAIFGHRLSTVTWSGCGEIGGNDFMVTLGEWNTYCIGPGANGRMDTAEAGDDFSSANGIHSGPNLVCDTTAAGDDFQIVAVGNSPTRDIDGDGLDDRTVGTVQQQADTLMHELGHNLNLRHGGDDNTNFKPNYLSIMNYAFQGRGGIPPTDPDGPTGPLTGRVDYSQADLADLDENNLNEPAGIGDGTDDTRYSCPDRTINTQPGTGPIDWNCNNDGAAETSVAVDINGDGSFAVLTGLDDWENVKLDFQNTEDFEDGSHITFTDIAEMDYFTTLLMLDVDIKPRSDPNCIKSSSKGSTPVAILSTSSIALSAIKLETVELDDDNSPNTPGITQSRCSLKKDVDGDGSPDLVCHFSTPELKAGGLFDGAHPTQGKILYITTTLDDNTQVFGLDVIHLAGESTTCLD